MTRSISISALVKNEIAVLPAAECCRTAALSALIHSAGTLNFSAKGMCVIVAAESDSVLTLFCECAAALYGKTADIDGGKARLEGGDTTQILADLGILKVGAQIKLEAGINRFLVESECCKRAYIKGIFLGCGLLAAPKSGYNLEFIFTSKELRDDVKKLTDYFELKSGAAEKNGRHRLYFKDKESVSDVLALIGANKAVLELNLLAAERDLKRTASRKANCDIANLDRSVNASMRQCQAIRALNGKLTDKKLLETAQARLQNPEASYEEIAMILNISKSAVKYRLNRIVEISMTNYKTNDELRMTNDELL